MNDLKLFPEKNMSTPPIHYRSSLEILPYFSIDLEAGHLEAHFPTSRLLASPVNSTSLTLHLSWVLVFAWVRFLDLSLLPNITLKAHAFFWGHVNQGASEVSIIHISLALIPLL